MDKKRKVKLILVILIWIAALIVAGFVVAAYSRLNSPNVRPDRYSNASFYGQDGDSKIEFDNDVKYAYVVTSEHRGGYDVTYAENMFILTSVTNAEDVQYYIIIDDNFAFGNNQYWLIEGI